MNASKPKRNASPRLLANDPQAEPSHEEIALCAYSLWVQRGRPQNEEIGLWLQAEAQLREARDQHGVQA